MADKMMSEQDVITHSVTGNAIAAEEDVNIYDIGNVTVANGNRDGCFYWMCI